MKDKNPIGTRACLKIASYVKSTYFFPRKSQESTYIFLRILPLSFLLTKKNNNTIIKSWACIQDMDSRDGGVCGTNLLQEISEKLIRKPSNQCNLD